jgi:hypothetical protein
VRYQYPGSRVLSQVAGRASFRLYWRLLAIWNEIVAFDTSVLDKALAARAAGRERQRQSVLARLEALLEQAGARFGLHRAYFADRSSGRDGSRITLMLMSPS